MDCQSAYAFLPVIFEKNGQVNLIVSRSAVIKLKKRASGQNNGQESADGILKGRDR